MTVESDFQCLRCGHWFKAPYEKSKPEERTCPNCGSNSVRPIEKNK